MTDYTPIIAGDFRWDKWAAPRLNGEFDHDTARIGDDLIKFVDQELFPYLAAFRQSATSADTIQYKIGEVFTELRNKFRSGYILRDVVEAVDELSFNTQAQRHELSQLYETRIRRMGNAGRNGGEYYTPRPLIRAMIKVTAPKIGETIYDGAVGSAGFLCEAYDYMRTDNLSASEFETLQTKTLYGQEKKGLAYIIGIMNMVLHGIEAPNLIHSNTLNENVMDIQEKDRHDIPVHFVDGAWVTESGRRLTASNGTSAEFVMPKDEASKLWPKRIVHARECAQFLEHGVALRIALRVRQLDELKGALIKHLISPRDMFGKVEWGKVQGWHSTEAHFFEIALGEPSKDQKEEFPDFTGGLLIGVRGMDVYEVTPSPFDLPEGISERKPQTLNHAYTILSEIYEIHRASHTGSIYQTVFYQGEDKRWQPHRQA